MLPLMGARIEDYALIGDCESAALVSRGGSVDWLCWPRFDSDACFAALLGTERHGRFRIAPAGEGWRLARRYREHTLVLETDFEGAAGAVRLIDFMPVRADGPRLVRIVLGLRGQVAMRLDLDPRFDYGSVLPRARPDEHGSCAVVGPDLVALRAPVPLAVAGGSTRAEFTVSAGQRLAFVLAYGASSRPPPGPLDAEAALRDTEAFWRDWAGRFNKPTRWREPVLRSLLTLKALIHRPTGGLVAAATTSLPERAGGGMNWDYRYCWIRDATFTLGALLNAGYAEEALAWRDWLLRAAGGDPDKLHIMYRVDGGRRMDEWEAPWLPGHEGAAPVRIGNAAAGQRQLDVFGEVADVLHLSARAGLPRNPWGLGLEAELIGHVERIWRQPDHGIWELRGEPRHYTYSKVMAWVAVDRFLRGPGTRDGADGATLRRLGALRDEIHAEVCARGFDRARGRFVGHFGSSSLDASLLLLPLVGFLPADDPRVRATVAAVERELTRDGLVRRYDAAGPGPHEGAFIACGFWLADCMALQGRHREAAAQLERMLDLRNDVGLLSEEFDPVRGCQAGNVPQALSHLALVNTALGLSGPILQRGG